MPTRLSSYYNDPAIGQGFESIAKAFAPMDGTEMLAGEKAKATKEAASRLAAYYDLTKNPAVTRAEIDRMGIGAGAFTPNQSYGAIELNNATTRDTNALDNARALQQTRLQQQGETDRSMLAPVAEGATRFVPPSLADLYKVGPTQVGNVTVKPGERTITPDGRTIQGADIPLTEAQAKGAGIMRLGEADLRRIVMSGAGTQNAIVDGQPRVVYGADAADRGLAPAATPTAPTFVGNYDAGNGASGPAVLDNGRIVNPQSREAIPANAQVRSAAVQGTPDQFGKSTEREGTAAYAARMVDGATSDILQAFDTGKLPTRADAALRSASEMAPGIIAPEFITRMSPEGQTFYQNVRTALPMQLLVQSGQGVTEREYERKMAELVPVPGEDKAVTAAKRRQFATYAAAVKGLAGNALGKVNSVPASADPNAAPAPASGGYSEGTVIENDAGQRMIRRGGKWEPHNG